MTSCKAWYRYLKKHRGNVEKVASLCEKSKSSVYECYAHIDYMDNVAPDWLDSEVSDMSESDDLSNACEIEEEKNTLSKKATRPLRELKRIDPNLHNAVLDDVLQLEEPTIKKIKEIIRSKTIEALPEAEPLESIVHDSIENILNYLEPESVDLILTDPPYAKEFLPSWSILSKQASSLLKPDGLLITYSGHAHLPEVYSHLGEKLEYVWTMALLQAGAACAYFPARMNTRWKPLLIYKRAGAEITYEWRDDIVSGTGREKDGHEWQQALGEAEELIKHFSHERALVVDPFLGSGTTVLAAKNTGRSFFGMDIDLGSIKTTNARLANEE